MLKHQHSGTLRQEGGLHIQAQPEQLSKTLFKNKNKKGRGYKGPEFTRKKLKMSILSDILFNP